MSWEWDLVMGIVFQDFYCYCVDSVGSYLLIFVDLRDIFVVIPKWGIYFIL